MSQTKTEAVAQNAGKAEAPKPAAPKAGPFAGVGAILDSLEYGPAPESPSAVNKWLDDHKRKFGYFCNNQWVIPEGREYYQSINPCNMQKIADIIEPNGEDVDKCVRAAQVALGSWQTLSGHERARYMYAIARNIQKHHRILAVLEVTSWLIYPVHGQRKDHPREP